MYAFAQRIDTTVLDEPLYAYFLQKTGIDHPGREEILNSMPAGRAECIEEIQVKNYPTDIVFFKNMAHHFLDLPNALLDNLTNIFLYREPKYVISSYIKERENPEIEDLGYKKILEMTDYLRENDKGVFLIDSKEVLKSPRKALKAICDHAEIDFTPLMLNWNKGGIDEDGIWAKFWYKSLHKSEGFIPFSEKEAKIPKRLTPLLKECEIIYEILQDRSINI